MWISERLLSGHITVTERQNKVGLRHDYVGLFKFI